jgi:hypothetical protein
MLHSSLSAASELRYQADGIRNVLRRAERLLKSANATGTKACAERTELGQDVLLGDVLAETIAAMALTTDEARSLLLVLGAVRESVYERTLWRLAVDEVRDLTRRQ